MIGIVYATLDEAQAFIDLAGLTPMENTLLPCYQKPEQMVLILCGIGKVAAAVGTQYLLQRFQIGPILHGGICGALKDDAGFQPGAVFCMRATTEGPPGPGIPDPAPACDTGLFGDLPRATLISLERPLFDSARRAELSAQADLVDMEGAVVARIATLYKRPWAIVKGVTDLARTDDRGLLKQHMDTVSEAVAQQLWRALQTINGVKGS